MKPPVSILEFIRSIPPGKTVPGTSWITDGHIRGTIEAMQFVDPIDRSLRLFLAQDGPNWNCVAEVPLQENRGQVAYVDFSILSFIAAWNAGQEHCRIRTADIRLELLLDVRDPVIHRHPSMMPMEIRYDHKGKIFKKRIVYPSGVMSEGMVVARQNR